MNWFSGNIAEAVALSKAKNSIFVVYCEGSDELSTAFTELINNDTIRNELESENFVAIKVQSDSEAYMQFAQIYKLVPLPSLFFIGKNGAPIEIVTGVTKTVDELKSKIDKVLGETKAGASSISSASTSIASNSSAASTASTASANLIASEQSATNEDTEVVCENGVCYKRPKAVSKILATPQSEAPVEITNEEKLAHAKELIDKKRKEKEEEDARLAKERELQRRRVGQDLQNFKQRQEESEMKKLQEERKRDKIEEQAARKRILEQIALDKAERAQRFNPVQTPTPKPEASTSESNPLPSVVSDSTVARIQFKKPDGEIDVKTFGRDEPFSIVRTYVEENVIVGSTIREFALATTFPRREFKVDDDAKTVSELGLVPSSVLLVLPLDKAPTRKLPLETSYGFFSMLTTIFWGVVNPMFTAFSYVRNWVFSRNRNQTGAAKRSNEEELNHNEQAKKRILRFDQQQPSSSTSAEQKSQSGPYKRLGGAGSNIHRLSDTRDSDDENNTWNGNSTQQQ